VIRDDTDVPTSYGALLNHPSIRIRKELVVREPLRGDSQAALLIYGAFSRDARWTLSVNGVETPGPSAPTTDVGWLRIPLRPGVIRTGVNTIEMTCQDGAVRVGIDDTFDFGRSAIRGIDKAWQRDRLDTETWLRYRALHMADGEFKIRLETQRTGDSR